MSVNGIMRSLGYSDARRDAATWAGCPSHVRTGAGCPDHGRGGFTLIELLLVVAIIALLIAILVPSLVGARKSARMQLCQASMRMFGMGFQNYAGDARGLMASFSWKVDQMTPSEFPDNRIIPPTVEVAHAWQAV